MLFLSRPATRSRGPPEKGGYVQNSRQISVTVGRSSGVLPGTVAKPPGPNMGVVTRASQAQAGLFRSGQKLPGLGLAT